MIDATTPVDSTCPSCGANRQGRYCAECGEKFISPKDFELKHLLLEQLPHEFLHLDGKLPRTIRLLLTQPGALARNYVAGRRQPFVGPLRLYIVLFLLQVIVGAFFSARGSSFLEHVRDSDPFGVLAAQHDRLRRSRRRILLSPGRELRDGAGRQRHDGKSSGPGR